MLTSNRTNEEETEAGALDLDGVAAGNTIKAIEDAFVLVGRKAETAVGNAECDPGVARDGEGAAYVDSAGGVFDGIVEEVEDGGAEIFGDALDVESDCAGDRLENDAVGFEVVALEGDGDAIGDEGCEVDEGAVLLAVALA